MSNDIKNKIIDKINSLKKGDDNDIQLSNEIQKSIKEIQCFYCFDTKKLWGYRSSYHVFWSRFANNHNKFYVCQCNKCDNNKFLYDIDNNEITINDCYKLFYIDDITADTRINELIRIAKKNIDNNINKSDFIKKIVDDFIKNDIIKNNDTKNNFVIEEPDYEVEANFFTQKITKATISADIKKISQILGGVLQAHVGIPNIDLLSKIELSISYESINNRKEQVFYKSTDNNDYFIFIIIKHIVKDKNGKMLSIFGGEKHDTNIDCYYWIYKTKNQLAIDICKKKIKDAVENEINFMDNILKSHYDNKL